MPDRWTVRHWGAEQAATQLDSILPTYEEVYADPPYCEGPRDVADFIERFRRQIDRPGFHLVTASAANEVIGFTFGYRLSADTQWWSGLLEPVSESFIRETGDRTFVIIELAVRKPWRRCGIATSLHRALLSGTAVERVTLTMRPEPEAAPAQAAYARWGYRAVGSSQPWDEAPVYQSMILELDG